MGVAVVQISPHGKWGASGVLSVHPILVSPSATGRMSNGPPRTPRAGDNHPEALQLQDRFDKLMDLRTPFLQTAPPPRTTKQQRAGPLETN